MSKQSYDQEYIEIVRDILEHQEFIKLSGFFHHTTSILEHAQQVSLLTFRICKTLHLDYVSATRGALLHDFFLYDWHEYKRRGNRPNHGLNHPKVALNNSLKYFTLNALERDVILKHMWPKVFGIPRHLESWVVSFADKYVTLAEFVGVARRFLTSRLNSKRR